MFSEGIQDKHKNYYQKKKQGELPGWLQQIVRCRKNARCRLLESKVEVKLKVKALA